MTESVFEKTTLKEIYEEVRTVYLSDNRPWIIGFSGGKDSTCMAQLVWNALSELPTEKLQKMIKSPVIYSATRGVHKRMISDLKRYTKFYSVYNSATKSKYVSKMYEQRMKKCGIKTKKLSNPLTLELAKIVVDTSYYGWLINYAQISKIISDKYAVDYDEMWSFSDEIHKFLKNRPKMFPGFIGGHCVIPNLELIDNELLNQIDKINKNFVKKKKKSN